MFTHDPGEEDLDELARIFIEHQLMAETQSYVARGRTYERISNEEGADSWIAAFEAWLDCRTAATTQRLDDIAAELRLRGLELPLARAQAAVDRLRSEVTRSSTANVSIDSERKIDAFLEEYRKRKH